MIRFVDQVDLAGKRVFVRVDLDAPADEQGELGDDHRIRAALPTLRHVLDKGGRLIVASHRGHPAAPSPADSLEPAAARLAELLDREVRLADDCVGDGVKKLVLDMRPGDVVMLENLRFHRDEEANAPDFARALAALCDAYVNDAFSACHRARASTVGMLAFVSGPKVAGLLLKKELELLGGALRDPQRPFVAVLGGAQVPDKVKVVEGLLPRVDAVLVGGAVAYAFLAAQGVSVGASRLELPTVAAARQVLETAKRLGAKLLLPSDHACGERADEKDRRVLVSDAAIPEGLVGLDIGPRTAAGFAVEIRRGRTVFWTGPMGRCERARFGEGTEAVARALCEVKGAALVAGGDSFAAMHRLGLAGRVSHVSTGGGASLELVEGRELPGVKALEG